MLQGAERSHYCQCGQRKGERGRWWISEVCSLCKIRTVVQSKSAQLKKNAQLKKKNHIPNMDLRAHKLSPKKASLNFYVGKKNNTQNIHTNRVHLNFCIFRQDYQPLKIILKAQHSFTSIRKYCKHTVCNTEAAKVIFTLPVNSDIKLAGIRIFSF